MKAIKNIVLIISILCSFGIASISCMEEGQAEELILVNNLVKSWKDKKEIIIKYMKDAADLKKSQTYIEGGKTLAVFDPTGLVTFYSPLERQTMHGEIFLALIESMNNYQVKESESNETTPLIQKSPKKKWWHLA